MKALGKQILVLIAVIVVFSAITISASASGTIAYGAATVAGSDLNVRTGPDTSHSVVTMLSEGDIIVILERTNSEWYYINFHGMKGYVNVPFLRDILVAENFSAVGRITATDVNLRSKPDTSSDILGRYSDETMVVIGINDGWYKVSHDGKTGYVRSDFMEITSGYRASSASNTVSAKASTANASVGQQIVDYALGYIGSPYRYGGSSPDGFDCSGFVSYVYKNFGYTLTRSSAGMFRDNGVTVSKSELIAGDLLFFSSNGGRSVTHVGIYIGDDEFVHSSTSSTGVLISRLDSAYYLRVWHGAKRVV